MAHDPPPELGPQPQGERQSCAEKTVLFVGVCIPMLIGLCSLFIFVRDVTSEETVFRVAITGVTGLELEGAVVDYLPTSTPEAAAAAAALVSPVFNLTFQIDNTRNSDYDACVPSLSTVYVSYWGAFLATGSVPPLCAGKNLSDTVAATASGENVAVPRFLVDQLAAGGDASVDVKVAMPTYCCHGSCGSAVLSCEPKIGGRKLSAACRLHCPHPFRLYNKVVQFVPVIFTS